MESVCRRLSEPSTTCFMWSGPAVRCGPLAAIVRIGFKAELGGDDDVVADRCEGFPYNFFVDIRSVDFGGIEECDPASDRVLRSASKSAGETFFHQDSKWFR